MSLFVDLLVAFASFLVAFLVAEWYGRSASTPASPAHFLPTLALGCALVGGVLLGVLVYLVRNVPAVQHVDSVVARWAYTHRTSFSTSGLHAVTQLGRIWIVVGLAIVLVAVDFHRTRSRWPLPFLVAVIGGTEILSLSVKELVGRVRPALVPAAASLGPSFPSGHSAMSAAFYAAAALIIGRRLARRRRHILFGLAVGIAVAVAASRVLLDLHWLSDVVGGLVLGWSWFALCAAVFGSTLLKSTGDRRRREA